MAKLLTIDVDASAVLEAMRRLGDRADVPVKAASKVTAENIAREAKGRIARRTGETASHIVVEESHDGKGYVAWVEPDVKISLHTSRSGRTHTQSVTYSSVGRFLEFGTKHMTKREFLFPSARLEERPHLDRLAEALQDAIDDAGLGD
jgi:hypothetical protein